METIIFPTKQWLSTLQVGDSVSVLSTQRVGGEITVYNSKIKSISNTGLIKVVGLSYSFKDGYRRGYQYSGNCWLQRTSQ